MSIPYIYLNISDVRDIYITLNGTEKNFSSFEKQATSIASKSKGGCYIFKNEDALFDLFKSVFPDELKARKITLFGELVQLI